jgi:hypothetical protein
LVQVGDLDEDGRQVKSPFIPSHIAKGKKEQPCDQQRRAEHHHPNKGRAEDAL